MITHNGASRGRRKERAHQYRIMAERLQFHLQRGNLSEDVTRLVGTAHEALIAAAQIMEESARDLRLKQQAERSRAAT